MSVWRFVASNVNQLFARFSYRIGKMGSEMPVVVILGATGTGKSKLSLDLARHFECEVISADSMQIYKGLDIVTNKVTEEERKLVQHHCIDCLDPLSVNTVVDYRNKALPIIKSVLESRKLPLIVGGTNYYIESLMWDVLINPDSKKDILVKDYEKGDHRDLSGEDTINKNNIRDFKISFDALKNLSNEYLYDLLKEIDCEGVVGLHPNDRRKVIRRLQVFQQSGRTFTEIISDQKSNNDGCSLGGPLRFKNSVFLWLQCDRTILSDRVCKRVDAMIENGLIKELLTFHEMYNKKRFDENRDADYTEGIFQSIGFKEFHPYLILDEEARESKKGRKLLDKCIEQLKLSTWKYAKYQDKWLKNRLMNPDRATPPIFKLDANDVKNWETNVTEVAVNIIKSFAERKPLPSSITPFSYENLDTEEHSEKHRMYRCEICERLIIGTLNWKTHLKSRRHENVVSSRKKLCRLLEQREIQLKASDHN